MAASNAKGKHGYLLGFVPVVLGAVLLAYPTYSSSLHQSRQAVIVDAYDRQVEALQQEGHTAALAAAREYNDAMAAQRPPDFGGEAPPDYWSLLDIDGMMGSIEIPAIELTLAIYHGTGNEVLRKGVGHMETTALPVGGAGTHCALTAHTGTTPKLFTDINKLVIGDVFYLHVLNETLAYEVDQTLIVHPTDTTALAPLPGEDLVTLITCTPQSVNSHRLLVRGHRVEYQPEVYEQAVEDAVARITIPWQYLVSGGAVLLCGLVLAATRLQKRRRRKP